MSVAHYEAPIRASDPVFNLDLIPSGPQCRMPAPHWHDCLELNYVRRGRGHYRIGNLVFPLSPGAVFVIPPGTPHQSVPDPEAPHWNLTVYLRPESVARLGAESRAMVQGLMAAVQHRLATDAPREWEHAVTQLQDEALRRPRDPDPEMIATKLLQACLLVRRAVPATDAPVTVPSLRDRTAARHVARVFAHIETHLNVPLTVADIARQLGLDPGYVGALFHRHTGMRLLDYMTLRRLEIARSLLMTSDLPLREVARRSGFRDASTFYRRFRRHFARTPGTLR